MIIKMWCFKNYEAGLKLFRRKFTSLSVYIIKQERLKTNELRINLKI